MAYSKAGIGVVSLAVCFAGFAEDSRSERSTELYRQTFGARAADVRLIPEAVALWRELSAEQDPSAAYYLSAAYAQGAPGLLERDERRALELLAQAATGRLPEAQFALAWRHESGEGTARDWSRALTLYQDAATQGYALAISRLIRVYSQGELGQSPDTEKASYWRSKARDYLH